MVVSSFVFALSTVLVTKPTYGAIQQNNDSQYKSVDNIENRDTNQRDSLIEMLNIQKQIIMKRLQIRVIIIVKTP